MSQCCLSGFSWDGSATGQETKLAKNDTYVTGSNKDIAIMIIHDLYGWTFQNLRLLADHFAKEVNATVYLPDFFEGEVVASDTMTNPEKAKNFDLKAFLFERHTKEKRFPEIEAAAKALKQDHGFKKVGAIGYCWGGWAVFQLGAKGKNLVDVISSPHPSMLTKEEVANVAVPVQIIAAEHDPMLTPELKEHCNSTIPALGLAYDYQYFPGAQHGFAVKCDESDPKQRKDLERAKNAAAAWFTQFLHLH